MRDDHTNLLVLQLKAFALPITVERANRRSLTQKYANRPQNAFTSVVEYTYSKASTVCFILDCDSEGCEIYSCQERAFQ